MRKFLATALIIAYVVFAPMCFVVLPLFGGLGMHHASAQHIGHSPEAKSCGAVGECDPVPFDDIDQHAAMYHAVTTSVPYVTPLLLEYVVMFVLYVLVFARIEISVSLHRAATQCDRLRQQWSCVQRKQLHHWQSLLLNSPNQFAQYA